MVGERPEVQDKPIVSMVAPEPVAHDICSVPGVDGRATQSTGAIMDQRFRLIRPAGRRFQKRRGKIPKDRWLRTRPFGGIRNIHLQASADDERALGYGTTDGEIQHHLREAIASAFE